MALGIAGIPSEQYGVIDKAKPVPSRTPKSCEDGAYQSPACSVSGETTA